MKFDKWFEYALGDVCTVTDCLHKTAPSVEYATPYRMLRTANIRNGKIDAHNTKSVTKETYEKWSVRGYLDIGDVVLTREAPMGEVGLIRTNDYKFFLGQRMLQLKANKEVITPEFLYYSLQGRDLQHQINMNEGTGSVVSNIRIPLLKKMKVKVPPMEIQNKITNILSSLDEKEEMNKQIIDNLEEIAQSLFKHWFIDFEFPNEDGVPYRFSGREMVESELGLIPEGWEVGAASNLFEFSPKTSLKKGGNAPYVEMKNLKSSAMINDWTNKEFKGSGSKFLNGDTLLARITPCLENGKIGYVNFLKPNQVGWGSTEFITIRSKSHVSPVFTYYFASQPHFKSYAIMNMNGSSGRQRVKAETLAQYQMALPPSYLINNYTDLVEPIMDKMRIIRDENNNLKAMRDILLPKLISGEIDLCEVKKDVLV
ncbi:restriction endonuclease subunit S [Halobacillus sp. BAB-2008]|uniref:restriction endonuclease subunit S n=1 Tax=Halobacillus sp. BAB-2008 TaxID=1246484 RepID=UPI0002A4DF84|nr:restriction endonuclease subunit S [Halobacillus sp. BAB-2008]ELK47880.1 restriction modification system DNA specificity domain-containing protein [Halobacillus sp. BAB-2008]